MLPRLNPAERLTYDQRVMIRASRVRELSLQMLCTWDSTGDADERVAMQIAADGSDDVTTRMNAIETTHKVWDGRKTTDEWVVRLAPQWPTRRQPLVDRNILRLAVWELTSKTTPPKVVLDEAIELAKTYSTAESPSFINGVLDGVLRELTGLAG